MSEREQIRKIIFEKFPNGYSKNPVPGYCHYLLKDEEGKYTLAHLTSGMFLGMGEFAIPAKYYENPEEMYNDIKLYFNPKA